ncbi:MAG: exo-alpha-sialidase [Chloroflexi bacterium]|nr:MAG: exo-alpha-sialidase [Chloroflexota bacterium]
MTIHPHGLALRQVQSISYALLLLVLLLAGGCVAAGNVYSDRPTSHVLADEVVFELAIDPKTPTTVYAATERGVFKSTDGGENWTAPNSDSRYRALAIDPVTPSTLYAEICHNDDCSVDKTTDGGMTWSATSMTTPVTALAIAPTMPTTLYAATWTGVVTESFVFKSTDGGEIWRAASTGIEPIDDNTRVVVVALAIDPRTPTTLYAATRGDGVYKSTDGGENWSASNTGLTSLYLVDLVIGPQAPTTLYVATNNRGSFKSTDGGGHWTLMTHMNISALEIDPIMPANLYAAKYTPQFVSWVFYGHDEIGGLAISTNGGANWSFGSLANVNGRINDLAIDPKTPTTLYVATDHGVYVLHLGK